MRLLKKLVRVGNGSLMIIIDKVIVNTMDLHKGDRILVDIIRKMKRKKDA